MYQHRSVIGPKHGIACASLLAAALASPAALAQNVDYGVACQEEFDNLTLVDTACDSANAFHAQMDQIGTRIFNYNLTGSIGPRILEEIYDSNTKVESTDITYVVTHMGAWRKDGADFAGKSYPDVAALSKNMVLGNEGKGLSVLALAGCSPIAWSPRAGGDGVNTPHYAVAEGFIARWANAFSGGLRIIVGNWDEFFSHKDHGKVFGSSLRSGYTIEDAWEHADARTVIQNDTATAATGTNSSDCWKRLSEMKITNLSSYGRLRGTQVGYYCQNWWTWDSLGDH